MDISIFERGSIMKKKITAWVLLFAISLGLWGCGSDIPESHPSVGAPISPGETIGALELLSAIPRQSVEEKAPDEKLSSSMTDFSLSLLQSSYVPGENTVLSPYSLYIALSMTANGAQGDTLSQMEALLGLSSEELNSYALHLQSTGGKELSEANSLWLRDTLSVQETFLQTLKNYYSAQVYSSPFDSSTLEAMNSWIKDRTNDRIPQALDQMNPNAMLYLINALTFDGRWKTAYNKQDVTNQVFYGSHGEQTVEMMTSTESLYLDDGQATGFLKDYEGGQYSFMALLPKEGLSLEDYLSSLTAEALLHTIEEAKVTSVVATMPKLQTESSLELQDILKSMGMVDAFTMDADFSGINGREDLCISRILHKTYLQVDEAGTQAGAVTIEEFVTKGIEVNQEFVFLNLPYLMGIYDKVNGCFLFLGTVENPG